ncbi:hypothetical protein F5051DRAFT_180670 [Lentinula edodes]|nr:hypothetical protein F5051DRAFT_180670 [Lentinula edodes]
MVVLPAEIFNIIFSLIDDQHSLANLALTSSLFLQCSRPYYFRSIIITAENVTKLADLLTNPYQTISGRIRELHLIDAPFNDDGPPPRGLFEREDILIFVASSIGPTATSMFLDCIDLVSFHPRVYQQFLSGFPNLLSIELDSVSFASVSQVLCMLGSFHSLESASLNNIGWGSPTNDTPDNVYNYEIPPSLRKLCLWGCYKRDVMKCFLSQKALPIIRELDLGLISPSDTEAIGEYIGRLGKDLASLSLGFSSLDAGGDAEDFYLNCNLSLNTQLESIHFDRLLYFAEYRLTNPWPWISRIISSIRSTALTTICFSIYLPHSHLSNSYFHFCWSEMDQFFNQRMMMLPCFKHLQLRICFDFSPDPDMIPLVLDKIEKKLPLCNEGGILQMKINTQH